MGQAIVTRNLIQTHSICARNTHGPHSHTQAKFVPWRPKWNLFSDFCRTISRFYPFLSVIYHQTLFLHSDPWKNEKNFFFQEKWIATRFEACKVLFTQNKQTKFLFACIGFDYFSRQNARRRRALYYLSEWNWNPCNFEFWEKGTKRWIEMWYSTCGDFQRKKKTEKSEKIRIRRNVMALPKRRMNAPKSN